MASTCRRDETGLFARVEALADRFQAEAVEEYVRWFSGIIAEELGLWRADELEARYRRVRRTRPFAGDPSRVGTVFVLSRVTLGAEIAVTSLALEAARRRFPSSRIVLVGGGKSRDLFAADPRIEHAPLDYERRAGLSRRLAAGLELRGRLAEPDSIVVDPDSRLTQLGLLPVCEEERYYFFESRSWGGQSHSAISRLTAEWLETAFGVAGLHPWIAPAGPRAAPCGIAVSFGVGENPAKRLPDPFERELLRGLAALGLPLLVDTGPGGEEAERVRRALAQARLPSEQVALFEGTFAQFALQIAAARLYVGYDSAGQHAAAALGVPCLTVFAGFPNERFFARWQPSGPGPKITVRVEDPADVEGVLARALEAARRLLAAGPAGLAQLSSMGTTRTNSPIT